MKKEEMRKARESICEGIANINEILGKVMEILKNGESPYYDTPRYIFRGITMYHPGRNETKKAA